MMIDTIVLIALIALAVGLSAAVVIFRAGAVDKPKAEAALLQAEKSASAGLSRLWARIRNKP